MTLAERKIDVLARFFGGQGTINVPCWSPDGRKIAFVTYQIDPVTSGPADVRGPRRHPWPSTFGTWRNREDSKVLTPSGVTPLEERGGPGGLVDQLQPALGSEEIDGGLQRVGGARRRGRPP